MPNQTDAMTTKQERIFEVVHYVSSLTPEEHPYEESGKYLPEELGVWTAAVRKEIRTTAVSKSDTC